MAPGRNVSGTPRGTATMSVRVGKLLLIALLALLSLGYLGKGFGYALFAPGASDLGRRWVEQRYVFRGQNPYDVALGAEPGDSRPPAGARAGRDATVDPAVGVPADVDYPPWSYFSGYLFFWPPLAAARVWFAAFNAAALAYVVSFVLHLTRGHATPDRSLAVLGVAASGALCTTIESGNYGVIVLALLAGAYRASESGRPAASGLLLGLAQLKPSLSGLFLLVPLARRQWRALAAAAAYLSFASGVVWAVTKTDPVEMTGQMVHAARKFVPAGAGFLNLVLNLGVPYAAAVPLTAAGCAALALALIVAARSDLLAQYATAGLACRLWTYHLNHSNLILSFLLLALWRAAVEGRRTAAWPAFLAVGVTLWAPARLSDVPAVKVAEHAVWLAALAWLVAAGHAGATGSAPEARAVGGDRITG
jgi:hypothetical protein